MILRRFTKHVTEQNWFAVGLDVIVVVLGIFLGMQLTEWNEDRKVKAEWRSTLESLQVEFTINLQSIEDNRQSLVARVGAVSQSLKMLLDCEIQPGEMELFQRGLMETRGTLGLSMRKIVLESILNESKFQSFLISNRKQHLQELLTQLGHNQSEAGFYESLPFDDIPSKHSAVKVVANDGKEYPYSVSLLVLAVPFEEACSDQGFVKSLDWWVNAQSAQLWVAKDLLVLFADARDTVSKWQGNNGK
jgi:hypothetical protein